MQKQRFLCTFIVVLMLLTFSGKEGIMISYGALTNLETSKWANEGVQEAHFLGLIPYALTIESLKEPITRGEFASLVVRVWERETNRKVKITKFSPFTDENGEDVLKAFALEVINGLGNGEYRSQENITREASSLVLARLYLKMTNDKSRSGKVQFFLDENEIHGWAKAAI